MRKTILLVLYLLFCLIFIVSCEKDKNSNSSSSEKEMSSSTSVDETTSTDSVSNEADKGLLTTETTAEYYYSISFNSNSAQQACVAIVNTQESLTSKLTELGVSHIYGLQAITEEMFNNCYVFVVLREKNTGIIMGYRNVTAVENGWFIVSDNYAVWDSFEVDENGKMHYYATAPSVSANSTRSCDVVIIPKSEFDTPPTAEKIQIHNVIHNFTK